MLEAVAGAAPEQEHVRRGKVQLLQARSSRRRRLDEAFGVGPAGFYEAIDQRRDRSAGHERPELRLVESDLDALEVDHRETARHLRLVEDVRRKSELPVRG